MHCKRNPWTGNNVVSQTLIKQRKNFTALKQDNVKKIFKKNSTIPYLNKPCQTCQNISKVNEKCHANFI